MPIGQGTPPPWAWTGGNGEHPTHNTDHHGNGPPREGRRERLNAAPPVAVDPGRSVADGAGVMPVTSRGQTVDQTSHQLMCDALRGVLLRAVHAGLGALDGIGSIQCQASAVLYLLLRDHPIDRRGRCRSCRRSGVMVGLRRRCCRIHLTASYWLLRQPDKAQLLSHLAGELGLDTAPPHGAGSPPDQSGPAPTARNDPSDTDVLPRIETEPLDPRIPPHQTPAVPPPLPPGSPESC